MERRLFRTALIRSVGGFVTIGALLFLPAGTFDFPAAWRYLGLLALCTVFAFATVLRRSPELLRRRLQKGEREPVQRKLVPAGTIVFFAFYALAGLDRRFGWSSVPLAAQLVSLAGVAVSYAGILWVFAANTWAGRTIVVESGQSVVSTGPYAVVRHPMYTTALVMYAFTPTALGSWVTLPLLLGVLAFLVLRIRNEEEVLRHDLPGYEEYTRKVRWRLLPGIW